MTPADIWWGALCLACFLIVSVMFICLLVSIYDERKKR